MGIDTQTMQDEDRVKTHREILKLFSELEEFEQELPQGLPEVTPFDIIHPEPELIDREEPEHIIDEHRRPKKRLQFHSNLKGEEKIRRRFLRKTGKQQPKTRHVHLLPKREPHGTFTLRLDETGNLVGFHVKEPVPKIADQFKDFVKKHRKTKAPAENQEPAKGIKGKLLRLIPKRGSKKEEGAEPSGRFSGITSKLKNIKNVIPSRKNKE